MRNALRPRAIRRLPRLLSLFLSRFTDARSLPYPLGLFLHPPCSCVSVRTRGTRRFFLSFAAARANSWHRRSPLRMIHRSRAAIAAHASYLSPFFHSTFRKPSISLRFLRVLYSPSVSSLSAPDTLLIEITPLAPKSCIYEITSKLRIVTRLWQAWTCNDVRDRILVGSNRLFGMNASLQQRKHIGWNEDEIATHVSLGTANRFRYQPVNWIVSCLEICTIAKWDDNEKKGEVLGYYSKPTIPSILIRANKI